MKRKQEGSLPRRFHHPLQKQHYLFTSLVPPILQNRFQCLQSQLTEFISFKEHGTCYSSHTSKFTFSQVGNLSKQCCSSSEGEEQGSLYEATSGSMSGSWQSTGVRSLEAAVGILASTTTFWYFSTSSQLMVVIVN